MRQSSESRFPPLRMTDRAFALLKWDVILFGRMDMMDKFVQQLKIGRTNPIQK